MWLPPLKKMKNSITDQHGEGKKEDEKETETDRGLFVFFFFSCRFLVGKLAALTQTMQRG